MSTAPGGVPTTDAQRSDVDPRPRVVVHGASAVVSGTRCTMCRYPTATALPRCPVCGAPCESAEFGPEGTVFSATVLRIPVPGRTPPFTLAYVDLDDGPRLLSHVGEVDRAPAPRSRVRLVGCTEHGDPLVVPTVEEARCGP